MYRAVESGQTSENRNVLRGKSGLILSSYASRDNLSPKQRQQQLSLIKSGFATNHAFKQRMKFSRKNIPIFNFHLKALLSLVLMRRCKSIKLLTLAVRYKPWSGCVAFWFIWSLSNVVCMWLLAGCCRVRLVKLERSAWFATDIPLWILFWRKRLVGCTQCLCLSVCLCVFTCSVFYMKLAKACEIKKKLCWRVPLLHPFKISIFDVLPSRFACAVNMELVSKMFSMSPVTFAWLRSVEEANKSKCCLLNEM